MAAMVVPVMVMIMRVIMVVVVMVGRSGRLRGMHQLHRLAMRGVEIGLAPRFLPRPDLVGRGHALAGQKGFERREPLPVIGRVVAFARPRGMRLDLGAED